MLTRNSQIEKLLEEGDFNVRVTVYNPTKAPSDPAKQRSAWLETIRDSLGGGIVNSSQQCETYIQNKDGYAIGTGIIAGKNIVKIIDLVCDVPQPLRITIKSNDSSTVRVWIIV